MRTIKNVAEIVRQRLNYHFAGTNGDWNIPKNIPFMQEFLNEVRTLCDLVLDQTSKEGGTALTPQLTEKINNHLHNLCRLDQHNELSAIFWSEQCRHEIDIHPYIDLWYRCECDFKQWFAKLPTGMQVRVIEYYKNLLKLNNL